MPRGMAYIYATTSAENLFNYLVKYFEKKKIQLEYPGTNKIQIWDSDGEMSQIDKEKINTIVPAISNYLIQFWWGEMDDVSLKIYTNEGINEACIYLDGLSDSHINDIFDTLLILIYSSDIRNEIIGFVFDRHEMISDYNWYNNVKSIDLIAKTQELLIKERYVIEEKLLASSDVLCLDDVFVAKRFIDKNLVELYTIALPV